MSRDVPHVVNGFNFQVIAALNLAVDKLSDLKCIAIENINDALLEFIGTKGENYFYYCQVKGTQNMYDNISSHWSYTKSGIKTLVENYNSFHKKGNKYYLITNTPYAFNDRVFSLQVDNYYNFQYLLNNVSSLKDKLSGLEVPKNNLFVINQLRFEGENPKLDTIRKLENYFQQCSFDSKTVNLSNAILESWHGRLFDSTTQKKVGKKIPKEKLTWDIISHRLSNEITEDNINSYDFAKALSQSVFKDIIIEGLSDLIQITTLRFKFFSKVTNLYYFFYKKQKSIDPTFADKQIADKFIEENYKLGFPEIEKMENKLFYEEYKKELGKVIIWFILYKKIIIDRIMGGMGYEYT